MSSLLCKIILWLVILILALVRYSGIKTDWSETTSVDTGQNITSNITYTVTQNTDIELSTVLGYFGIGIHFLLSIPILIFLCSGRQAKANGPYFRVCSETLNSWFLIIQVVVTGSDVSLYSMGLVSYTLVGLDLAISFMVILFQAVLRNIEFIETSEGHSKTDVPSETLRSVFLDEDDKEA